MESIIKFFAAILLVVVVTYIILQMPSWIILMIIGIGLMWLGWYFYNG